MIKIDISVEAATPQAAAYDLREFFASLAGNGTVVRDLMADTVLRNGGAPTEIQTPGAPSLSPITTDTPVASGAFTAADAAAALASAVETTKKRRGRPSAVELAQRQVEKAAAETLAADAPNASGDSLDELLGHAETPVEETRTEAGTVEPTAAPAPEAEPEPAAGDSELDALLGIGVEDDLDSLLGTIGEKKAAETYEGLTQEALFEEIKARATSPVKPLGAGWIREVIAASKKASLSAMTADEMRAALIKNDAGLAP